MKIRLMKEVVYYCAKNKKMWILPFACVIALVAMLTVVTQGSVLAPLIYTIF